MILTHGANSLKRGGGGDSATWDGSRDYSFYVGKSSPYYIETPEQYAALCYISNGRFATDETCPPTITERDWFEGKEVYLKNNLVFNDDYENNFDWIDLDYHSGHVNPPANDCTSLRLRFAGTFHGDFHSIKGFYYHQSEPAPNWTGPFQFLNMTRNATIENLYLENCSFKNFEQGNFAIFVCDYGSNQNYFYNVQVRHCRMVATLKISGGDGSAPLAYIVEVPGDDRTTYAYMYGCGIVDSDCTFYDYSGYASYRDNGLHLSGSNSNDGALYNDFNVNVNIHNNQYFWKGYIFIENQDQCRLNCLYNNVTATGDYPSFVYFDGTLKNSVPELITAHNAYSDGHSLKLDSELRYIPGQLAGT